jgi:hypothetical protein
MKTYDIYMGKHEVIFQPSQTGEWVNLQDITDDDIIGLHPTCRWCDHCVDDVIENEYEQTTVTISMCMIDGGHPRIISKNKHYCSYHTELK